MENIKINKEQLKKNLGIDIMEDIDYIYYMKNLVDYLESHNKNYTKEQYSKIVDLKEFFENIN